MRIAYFTAGAVTILFRLSKMAKGAAQNAGYFIVIEISLQSK